MTAPDLIIAEEKFVCDNGMSFLFPDALSRCVSQITQSNGSSRSYFRRELQTITDEYENKLTDSITAIRICHLKLTFDPVLLGLHTPQVFLNLI